MGAKQVWPWAVVLVGVVGAIVSLSFGRRGDPAWAATAAEPPPPVLAVPVVVPAAVILRGGLPRQGRFEVDVTTIQGEQTGQRGVHAGWRLEDDGSVTLREPAEGDGILPGEGRAVTGPDGTVTITGVDLPKEAIAAFADGVRALLALRGPLTPGERRVGERLIADGEHSLVTAAAPDRLAFAAEASSLPGAEQDETLVGLKDGIPVRIERHWTRRDATRTIVSRVTLTAKP